MRLGISDPASSGRQNPSELGESSVPRGEPREGLTHRYESFRPRRLVKPKGRVLLTPPTIQRGHNPHLAGTSHVAPPMRVEIRDARPSDREHLMRCLDAMHDRMVELDRGNRLQRTSDHGSVNLARLRREARKNEGFILVAEADGVPAAAAFAYLRTFSKEQRTAERPTKMGFLADLSVLPNWWGQGLGTQLLREVEIRFRRAGCDHLALGVFAPNRDAQRLYRRVGFRPEGLFMVKRLGRSPKRWPSAALRAGSSRRGRTKLRRQPARR